MRTRFVAAAILGMVVVFIFAVAGTLIAKSRVPPSEAPGTVASSADLRIKEAQIEEVTAGVRWRLKAEQALIFDAEGRTALRAINVDVFERDRAWNIVGEEGDFFQTTKNLEIRKNVVVTSSDGIRLETSVLRWQGAEKRLWTDAPVRISRGGAVADGSALDVRMADEYTTMGTRPRNLLGSPEVKPKAILVACLVLLIPAVSGAQSAPKSQPATKTSAAPASQPAGSGAASKTQPSANSLPLTIDSDKMERYGKASLVIFSGNVVARRDNSVQYADRLEVYMDEKGDRVLRTVSTGSVRIITKDCRTGTAQRAEYFDLDQRVVLSGNARVWQDDNVVSGDTITLYVAQDRTIVEGAKQERVKGIFYTQKDTKQDGQAAPRRAPEVCNN
jgi:lipopolysaccharide export system protein LptA